MVKLLFHGSDHVVRMPTFGLGKPYNDYGLGFYCTEHAKMAAEWAVGFDHDGFVNRYAFDSGGLTVVDLDAPAFTTLHWLAILLQNRWFDVRAPLANEARAYLIAHFSIDVSDVDVIEGSRADDSYFDRERTARRKGDLYISHIINEEMGANDERLR